MSENVVDLIESPWVFVVFWSAKSHCVHKSLLQSLLEDMSRRGHLPDEIHPCPELYIDLPGPIVMDEPKEDLRIDSLHLTTRSLDVTHMVNELRDLEIRRFSDGQEYYKLHGWMKCLVLTPTQKETLESRWWAVHERAQQDAVRFYEERGLLTGEDSN